MNYPVLIGKKYKVEQRLGTGTFGEVFKCRHIRTNKVFAMKLEKQSLANPQLLNEAKKYQYLLRDEKSTEIGIPKVYYFCKENGYNVLVMDMLGPSLEDTISKSMSGKFTVNQVVKLTIQMLNRLKYLHSKHFLHRDLKPDNFLLGNQEDEETANQVFIIDFGLSKPFIDKHGNHIPMRTGKQLVGTARYAAIPTHMGLEYGRRDDLESLAHILIYFLKGDLPWQNLPANTKEEKFTKIMQKKKEVPVEVLCKGFPKEFESLLSYARNLGFTDAVDYEYLQGMFSELTEKLMLDLNEPFKFQLKTQTSKIHLSEKQNQREKQQNEENIKTALLSKQKERDVTYQDKYNLRYNNTADKVQNQFKFNEVFERNLNSTNNKSTLNNASNNNNGFNQNVTTVQNFTTTNFSTLNTNNIPQQAQFGLNYQSNNQVQSHKRCNTAKLESNQLQQLQNQFENFCQERQILQQKEWNNLQSFNTTIRNSLQYK